MVPVPRRRVLGVLAILACVGIVPAARAADPVATPDIGAYRGLGTWVDIFDRGALDNPLTATRAMARRHVHTLYLETGNSQQSRAIADPVAVGALLEAAHARGLAVVGWYLPSLVSPRRDIARVRAAIRFRSPAGERFDSFGLDIESSAVRSLPTRNRRLVSLSRKIRAFAGPSYPLGAIIPAPVAMARSKTYWPTFPYRRLLGSYDVWLPMAYATYHVQGRTKTRTYTADNVALLRSAMRVPDLPVHVIGGLGESTSASEARGFTEAALAGGVLGASLYDFSTTSSSAWRVLASLVALPARRG